MQIVVSLLFYARSIDYIMIAALIYISLTQSNGIEATTKISTKLINYCAIYPNEKVPHQKIQMALHIHGNV